MGGCVECALLHHPDMCMCNTLLVHGGYQKGYLCGSLVFSSSVFAAVVTCLYS